MSRILKAMFCILLVFLLNFSYFGSAYAATDKTEYIENKKQIYFDKINVEVTDNEKLVFSIGSDVGLFERIKVNNEIDELNAYFEKYEETEKAIASAIVGDDLYAISFTEAPLKLKEGHFERMTVADDGLHSSSDDTPSQQYSFSLTTAIIRTGAPNAGGEYTYYGLTAGEWSEHSFLGGKKYPATGNDSIVQAVDPELVMNDSDIMATYVKNSNEYMDGVAGTHFSSETGGSNFIQYRIQDDPIGLWQLSSFLLTTEYFGQARNTSRQICSVYTHTWISMNIDVSIEIGTEVSADSQFKYELSSGAALVIDPGIELFCWNLFNSTSFAF